MVEKTALAEEQQMAEAADAVIERLDLIVDIVGRTGKQVALSINCSIVAVVWSTGLPWRSRTNPLRLPPAFSTATLAPTEL